MLNHRRGQARCERFITLGIQRAIVHHPVPLPQVVRKVPHGREKEGCARFVGPDMGGFLTRFDHQHQVLGGIEAVKRRRGFVKLVAQNQNQMAAHSVGHVAIVGAVGKNQCPAAQYGFLFVGYSANSAQGVVVVVRIGPVVAATQLHRHVFVGVGDALHTQQRCSVLHF